MKKTRKHFKYIMLSAFILLGTACSSGGGGGDDGVTFDGNEAPAAIDASNAEAIGTGSGEAVQKADASTSLPGALALGSSANVNQINSIVLSTADILTLPAAEELPGVCSSGSASISDVPSATSGPIEFTITYKTCAVTGTNIIADGKAVLDFDDVGNPDAGFTITYINFKVTDPVNGTTTLNLVMDCTNPASCTFNSDFVGSDGSTHRITDFSISGDASSGFNGSATFLHGTHGRVSITITDISYNGTCDPFPSGGSIAFSSSNGSSGTIIFNSDCTVSGTWNNGAGTSGSF